VSKYFAVDAVLTNVVFNERLTVIVHLHYFAVPQSALHELWMLRYGSTLETRPMYTPSDCFETFPFPSDLRRVAAVGEQFRAHRGDVMKDRKEGLTTTYNRFHSQTEVSGDVNVLRALQVEMDCCVAAAYGWTDLHLNHGFHETKQGIRYSISEEARREALDGRGLRQLDSRA